MEPRDALGATETALPVGEPGWDSRRAAPLLAELPRNRLAGFLAGDPGLGARLGCESVLEWPDRLGARILAGGPPGEAPEVLVRVGREGVAIAPYRARWVEIAPPPVPLLRRGALIGWEVLPTDPDKALPVLGALVREARRRRRQGYRRCRFCELLTPPEYRHEPNACMGCAERHLGVVH